jgi:hypothetical protein
MPKMAKRDFSGIRQWCGEQSRAFEELSFQLLKHQVPPGAKVVRTGNPDGGVEWYTALDDGIEWGWQAKFVNGIDALLTAMTDSVRRVALERPRLRKLVFVIHWNLATGTSGRERLSQREKFENKIKTWKRTIEGAEMIEFGLLQHSDLVDELAKPQHEGRVAFWWDDLALGQDRLWQLYRQQDSAAGEKYRPDLQVDVEIQDDLLALGFDRSILDKLSELCRALARAVDRLEVPEDENPEALRELGEKAQHVKTLALSMDLAPENSVVVLDSLQEAARACRDAAYAAEDYVHKRAEQNKTLPEGDPLKTDQYTQERMYYRLQNLLARIGELDEWLDATEGSLLRKPAYFLTGQAGTGKTHLLLDATKRALEAGRPAVFLPGTGLGKPLWEAIADQLGVASLGRDALLGAMESAGEAASLNGNRFLICIDALNETEPASFWKAHLPQLRAALESYPHIGLAVSCRDTYTEAVLDETESRQFVRQEHPGFAGREIEATQKYFAHFGLEAPRTPLLTPEFSVPLFLKLYCEAMHKSSPPIAVGHLGRTEIFERFLDAKVAAVARRYLPDPQSDFELREASSDVRQVLDDLLDELAIRGTESLGAATAMELAKRALEGSRKAARRMIGLLQHEGVLTRELIRLDDGELGEGVRVVFQAFSDFLLLQRRLKGHLNPAYDTELLEWLFTEASPGIVEAATVFFPERYGIELPDLLAAASRPSSEPRHASGSVSTRAAGGGSGGRRAKSTSPPGQWRDGQWLNYVFLRGLAHRDSSAVTARTVELLETVEHELLPRDFYELLFTLSPQPGSLLNGFWLHERLMAMPMPERDSTFGFATYRAVSEDPNAASRLARWAAAGPYPSYDPVVVELACIPLCWLLSSPNRYMRDWITKSLVQVLHGHLDVAKRLIERFWPVDDPYVVQRVVAIAYGALLRSGPDQTEAARALCKSVHRLVFTRPLRADELLLDAAAGILRWGEAQQLLPADLVEQSLQRPWGIDAPTPPPSKEELDAEYPPDPPGRGGYSSIYMSTDHYGDFGDYIVGRTIGDFSRFRLNQALPKDADVSDRVIPERWNHFLDSLTDEQRAQLGNRLDDPALFAAMRDLDRLIEHNQILTADQEELLGAAVIPAKPVREDYPHDEAQRWVFYRTISLGWTPERFQFEDRAVGLGHNREGHKAERWGKKYQWIAFHELLARVADNFHTSKTHREREPYQGLHELAGHREIDPSLPPVPFDDFISRTRVESPWQDPQVQFPVWPPQRLDMKRFQGDLDRFLADTASEPTLQGSILLDDDAGEPWLVLEGRFTQQDPQAHEELGGPEQPTSIYSFFIDAGQGQSLLDATPIDQHHRIYNVIDSHGHVNCCYLMEVAREHAPRCRNRHEQLREDLDSAEGFRVVSSVERFVWEGETYDCSIEATVSLPMPSAFLQRQARLTFDPAQSSWHDPQGDTLVCYKSDPALEGGALLVRASFLCQFLEANRLELIAIHSFERRQLGGSGPYQYVEGSTLARITKHLTIKEGSSRRTQHP